MIVIVVPALCGALDVAAVIAGESNENDLVKTLTKGNPSENV